MSFNSFFVIFTLRLFGQQMGDSLRKFNNDRIPMHTQK